MFTQLDTSSLKCLDFSSFGLLSLSFTILVHHILFDILWFLSYFIYCFLSFLINWCTHISIFLTFLYPSGFCIDSCLFPFNGSSFILLPWSFPSFAFIILLCSPPSFTSSPILISFSFPFLLPHTLYTSFSFLFILPFLRPSLYSFLLLPTPHSHSTPTLALSLPSFPSFSSSSSFYSIRHLISFLPSLPPLSLLSHPCLLFPPHFSSFPFSFTSSSPCPILSSSPPFCPSSLVPSLPLHSLLYLSTFDLPFSPSHTSVSFSYSFFPSPLPVLLHPSPSFILFVSLPILSFTFHFPIWAPPLVLYSLHPPPPPCCPLVHSKHSFLSPTPIPFHCLLLHLFSFILLTIHFKLFLFVLF